MKTVVILCLLCVSIACGPAIADPYVVLKVLQTEGVYSEARAWSDHSQDALFNSDDYDLNYPWVALDASATKYTTLGPDGENGWTAYVWAGYHMTADTPYDLTVAVYGPSQITCINYDSTSIFEVMMQAGETRTWTLSATPATASQWRTRGYRTTITPVPEPAPLMVLFGTLLSFAVKHRRNKL